MATRKPKRQVISRADFVGSKMANFLHSLKYNQALPLNLRTQASELQLQWDGICPLRLNNPITIVELEKALAAGKLK